MTTFKTTLLALVGLFTLIGCDNASKRSEVITTEPAIEGSRVAEYGSWASPVTPEDVYDLTDDITDVRATSQGIYFVQSNADNEDKKGVYRLELDGTASKVVSSNFDIRSRVHEYGGSPFVAIGSSLFATKFSDQILYRIAPNQAPFPLTPNGTRHAGCISNPKASRLICVREDHRGKGEPVNSLVGINLSYADEGNTLISGADFYSKPVLSPDQSQLAWVSWNHPNMPWDQTQLWIADLDSKGVIVNPRQINTELKGSITQPLFSPTGQLYFIADFNNWWNIYRLDVQLETEMVLEKQAEFAVADWKMGQSSYAFENEHSLIASFSHEGVAQLIRIDTLSGIVEPIAVDFAEIAHVTQSENEVLFVGGKETPEKGIYKVQGRFAQLVYAPKLPVMDPNFISRAQSLSFKTGDNQTAYGYLYQPKNPNFQGPKDHEPPLVMMMHPGPTAKASRAFRRDIQYWTSRGFAVFDVNYRGSTGFGRDYRNSLYGNWGKSDVEDAVRAAGFLVNSGHVDGRKLAIRGNRAGGFTALSAVAFYSTFGAGVSYSGISDMEEFKRHSHKFESHYLMRLLGNMDNYHRRSAMSNIKGLNEPLLLIQGVNDSLIPAEQSLIIYQAVKRKGVPVAYLEFNEDAANRVSAKSKKLALEAELSFYGQIFGFTPAGSLPALAIENIDNLRRR
ncbi:peptidase S9 prolyl oligopeptidase active site domain protein [Shewanella halifaxensis HAW-EB4]|uniref:Peptidase S9 prolyl oligopeptidase active site domain protein n=1 Tax=Shewanella halifaxensis (strain HAW-EB4) TaxID=458817 RepID=B0TMQ8_SHEHH|nr:prolyl oligopeptidase family serine peptidase [Shewanella halifaxensis]ABZ77418.1 peptidase S9 prolyl oligopeptidase active site domain protein [Shewanella halifaxensis HAW-EB4]